MRNASAHALAHQYYDTRTTLDVAIGPWRAIIDLFRMMHGGLGPARARARTAVP
jgi:hypothetical protein